MRAAALTLLLCLFFAGWALAAGQPETTEVVPAPAPEEEAAVEGSSAASDSKLDNTAGHAKKVYVYDNGCPACFATDEEWEFYEVERKDIRSGNWELMNEVGCCPPGGTLIVGAALDAADDNPQLSVRGPAPDGPVASGAWRKRTNIAGDWQELYFDFDGMDSYSSDYSRDTLRGNWDLSGFTRNGNVWGLRSDDDTAPSAHTWESGTRDRSMGELNYRNGSAEGGSWRMNLRHYDTEIGATAPAQVDDSRLTRLEVEGRMAECRTTLKGSAFAGNYGSTRAQLDNDFTGARFDGSHWLGDRVELQADGSVTRIDAGVQNAGATRSDFSAELGWDMTCDLRLSAFARGYNDNSEISAGASFSAWRDAGARFDYRPDGQTAVSASLTQRDIDSERLKIEDPAIAPFITQFNPLPTRADLAGLRAQETAGGTLLDIHARHRFSDDFYAGASLREQDYSNLPEVWGLLAGQAAPSYFSNHRAQASLHAEYDLCDLGNVTFRADTDHRSNADRGSSFQRDQYTLGYSAPLCRATRLGLGVTRQTTIIDTTDAVSDFAGEGWNYSLNLSGSSESDCVNYVISANHATSDAHQGGDLSSLGLELSFDSPWRISAWWRQFDDFLGGQNADDVGVQVGYKIDL